MAEKMMQSFIQRRNVVKEAEEMKIHILRNTNTKPKAVKLDVDEAKPLDPDDPLSFDKKDTKEEKDNKNAIDLKTKNLMDAVNAPVNVSKNLTTAQIPKPKKDDQKLTEQKSEVKAKAEANLDHLDDIKKQLEAIKTQNSITKKRVETLPKETKKEEKKEEKKYEEFVKKVYIPPKDAYPKKVEEPKVEKMTVVQSPPAEPKKDRKASFFHSVLAQNQSALVAKKDKEEEVIQKLETIQKNLEELKQ